MNRIIVILIVFALFSCGNQQSKKVAESDEKLNVITVNYPLYYFADRIGGDLIDLQYVIPEDVDPAYWMPDEDALELYQAADIILDNGADYAKWMNNVSLASSRIINTSASFEDSLIPLKNVASHKHGPEGEHQHKGFAFTTWLDFKLAIKQAESIKNTLIKRLPNKKIVLNENFKKLKEDLEILDKKLIEIALELNEINTLGSHPVYQYLSKAYQLNMTSVHFEPKEFPTKKQWEELDNLFADKKVMFMLWEDNPSGETILELKKRNMESVIFNPCGNKPAEGDFLSVMNDNINNLKK